MVSLVFAKDLNRVVCMEWSAPEILLDSSRVPRLRRNPRETVPGREAVSDTTVTPFSRTEVVCLRSLEVEVGYSRMDSVNGYGVRL